MGFTSTFITSQVASLRQQLEHLQQGDGGGRGVGSVRGGCGPEAPCSRSLVTMERAHQQALEELQKQHERQMRELENEKNRLLLEETQDTAQGTSARWVPKAFQCSNEIDLLFLTWKSFFPHYAFIKRDFSVGFTFPNLEKTFNYSHHLAGLNVCSAYVCVSVMEALKKKHKEELERVKRQSSGVIDSLTLRAQQQ